MKAYTSPAAEDVCRVVVVVVVVAGGAGGAAGDEAVVGGEPAAGVFDEGGDPPLGLSPDDDMVKLRRLC